MAGKTQCSKKKTYLTGSFSTTSPTSLRKPKNWLYQRQSRLNFNAGAGVLPPLLLLKLIRMRRRVTVDAGRMQ
jgi:hypothetical protein